MIKRKFCCETNKKGSYLDNTKAGRDYIKVKNYKKFVMKVKHPKSKKENPSRIHTKTCTKMFIAALFIISKR